MQKEKAKIGLPGAVAMTVGTVIGAGIYIMIGPLAVSVGPAMSLCYFLALLVAGASAVCYAQVATVLPATAATYKYARTFYSPFVGFAIGWLRWLTCCYSLALMGMGFARYLELPFLLDPRLIAAGILAVFYIVNVLGLKTTMRVQAVLVIIVLTGLLSFAGGGIPLIDRTNLTGLGNVGLGTILRGSMAAFFAYTGLYFVAEIGEEVKNPRRNIPLAIFLSSVCLGLIYLAVSLAFSGNFAWETIRRTQPNLAEAAHLLFDSRLANVVRLSALVAVFTPINTIFTTSSRFLAVLATDRYMPAFFAKNNRHQAPAWALTVNFIFALVVVFNDLSILFLGTITSLVTLIGMALVAGAALKLHKQSKVDLAGASLLSYGSLLFFAVFTITATVILALVSFHQDPSLLLYFGFWLTLGGIYYLIRQNYIHRLRTTYGR